MPTLILLSLSTRITGPLIEGARTLESSKVANGKIGAAEKKQIKQAPSTPNKPANTEPPMSRPHDQVVVVEIPTLSVEPPSNRQSAPRPLETHDQSPSRTPAASPASTQLVTPARKTRASLGAAHQSPSSTFSASPAANTRGARARQASLGPITAATTTTSKADTTPARRSVAGGGGRTPSKTMVARGWSSDEDEVKVDVTPLRRTPRAVKPRKM